MSQYYTRATAVSSNEVKIHFRCAKCGREVDLVRYLNYSDQGYANGISNNEAESKARLNLAGHVADDFRKDVEALKRNRATLRSAKDVTYSANAPLRCPGCDIVNIPDAGCERRMLIPVWCSKTIKREALLLVSPLILWVVLFSIIALSTDSPAKGALYSLIACIALVALAILNNRRLSKKAYDDPALMEKRYGSVPNKEVYADMTPYGLGMIHIGSEK